MIIRLVEGRSHQEFAGTKKDYEMRDASFRRTWAGNSEPQISRWRRYLVLTETDSKRSHPRQSLFRVSNWKDVALGISNTRPKTWLM